MAKAERDEALNTLVCNFPLLVRERVGMITVNRRQDCLLQC